MGCYPEKKTKLSLSMLLILFRPVDRTVNDRLTIRVEVVNILILTDSINKLLGKSLTKKRLIINKNV